MLIIQALFGSTPMFSKCVSIIAVIAVLLSRSMVAYSMEPATPLVSQMLAAHTYSLSDRYDNSFVNGIFADNILLTLAYMRGIEKAGIPVNWNSVRKDFTYTLTLTPGETFAFHDSLLPEYKSTDVITTNAHFNGTEGFESDGWLIGDGVCHLASFMNVVARSAHLNVVSPTLHDFAKIPDVPREESIAIYANPNDPTGSSEQNLYITNTFSLPIAFMFHHSGNTLTISVEKSN